MSTTTTVGTAVTHASRRVAVELQTRRPAPRGDTGQGTVEYVALILLVGAILSGVVIEGGKAHFNIATIIGGKLADMIKNVGTSK